MCNTGGYFAVYFCLNLFLLLSRSDIFSDIVLFGFIVW